ncbi:calcium-binding protein [Marinovum sp. 2_MG-2023]|uniref:calcium-binding protein n=1 Tax=unclassified Marinovum TaxID=2647166 RepID=UPI0026E2FC88|nr:MULTISPECIES: calcium-binding protein [unclassified Marinovum]MDO6732812.1 calcium-binding protein [Marinovum sp. 2_MG-2023]MDO6782107.1 calcium-binding protein [Marinovum sp. 1_MG-2023]
MLNLEFSAAIGASWGNLGIDIRDLELVDGFSGPFILAASGPLGGMVSFQMTNGSVQIIDRVSYNSNMAQAVSGKMTFVDTGGAQSVIGVYFAQGAVGYSVSSSGQIGQAVSMALPVHDGTSGLAMTTSAAGHVYAMTDMGRLQYFSADGSGGYQGGQVIWDNATSYLSDPVSLSTVTVGGQELLLSLCGDEGGLSVYRIAGGSGMLSQGDSIGAATGLGLLNTPTDLATVETGGRNFAIIASAADQGTGGALSVVELHSDGSVNVTDHLLDNLTTRFGRADSISIAQSGDWTYVAAGGGDAGISLFVLTPTGRLLHMDSLPDTTASGLEQISALTMFDADGMLQIFAASQSTIGLSQIEVSLAGQGRVIQATSGNITGTSNNDMLVGGSGANTISGGAGDDILMDGAGVDRLIGGVGADLFVLDADGVRDVIVDFNPNQDMLELSAVPMLYDPSRLQVTQTSRGAVLTFPGGEETEIRRLGGGSLTEEEIFAAIDWGADRTPFLSYNEVMGTGVADLINGTSGTDLIYGLDGADTLVGLSGADVLDGGDGGDRINGGTGDDQIMGGNGADYILAGAGNDAILDTSQGGSAGRDSVWGGDGEDSISTGGGDDLVDGEAGDDTIWGGWGNDTLAGGDGNDELRGSVGFDRLSGAAGDDYLDGGDGNDWLSGSGGEDTLLGGSNSDELIGGNGNDHLEGQHGYDRLDGGWGEDWMHGGTQNDTLVGGGGADTMYGANNNDRLEGQGGDDVMDGGQHNDWMHGGSGDDSMLGGGMNDTLFGGSGNDTLEGQYGADVIEGGMGNDWIHGGAMSDTIRAGSSSDTVNGGSGSDAIWLDDGDDLFNGYNQGGSLGRDTIRGGAGDDTVLASAGDDEIHGQAGNDLLSGGADRDLLTGGNGHDTLMGGMGNDTLHGGTGNDRLEAGLGNDDLTGGAGADTFVFFSGSGRNTISDFNPGVDLLELDVNAASFSDLTVTNAPRGVWLNWGNGEVLLEGLTAADIANGDIDFI